MKSRDWMRCEVGLEGGEPETFQPGFFSPVGFATGAGQRA